MGGIFGGGKKAADKLAKQQSDIQNKQFGLAQQQVGLGNAAIGGASNFWNALMKGGQAAVQATGPYASLIGQTTAGADQAIRATTARGGEQNLALAQNQIGGANSIARLYAGMQPLAAQGLSDVARAYFGVGSSFNPMANTGGAFQSYLGEMQANQQAGAGIGSLLYKLLLGGGL